MKYREWLKDWLDNYVRPTSKEKTYTRYFEIVHQHIISHLGDYNINELTPIIIQRFITYLSQSGNLKTGAGLSPNSVNGIITVIQCSLETANKIGLSDKYIADKVKRPKITEKKVSCFIPSEQKQIESAVMNDKKSKILG